MVPCLRGCSLLKLPHHFCDCNSQVETTRMLIKRLRGLFSSDLSIDLGTANTLIYVRERVSYSTSPPL